MWMVQRKVRGIEPPHALTPEMIPPSARGGNSQPVKEKVQSLILESSYFCNIIKASKKRPKYCCNRKHCQIVVEMKFIRFQNIYVYDSQQFISVPAAKIVTNINPRKRCT